MNKEKLHQKLNHYLNQANEEELDTLDRLLEAVKRKQRDEVRTYINGIMDYQGKMISEDTYEAWMTLNPFLMNPLQIIHGGMTATFADTAMGTMVYEFLPEDKASVTSEIKINYLKPGYGNKLKCLSKMVHFGNHLCVTQADIYREDGAKIAIATGSFFIIDRPKLT